jgi:lipopolysaccharide assembly outer membrane protein LptD (OstA)
MKALSIAIALAACSPVFSQDQSAINFRAFRATSGIRIEGTLNNETLMGTAGTLKHESSAHLVRLTGNVDLTIDGMRLRADEIVIDEDSGEIKPSGNVRVTMPK